MIGSLKLWNTSPNLRPHKPTTSRTHKKRKKINKRHSWRKIHWRPFTYLTSGSLNQGFLCEQKKGSGGAKQDKGLSDMLGAKILSEKKKEAWENWFVSLVGRTSALAH